MPRRAPARGDEPGADEQQQQQTAAAQATAEETVAEEAAAEQAEAEAEAEPAAPPAAPRRREEPATIPAIAGDVLRELGIVKQWAIDLIAEACFVFGIDPNPRREGPRQLLAFRMQEGDRRTWPPVPQQVTMVLGGGKKITYPIDKPTEDELRRIFNAWEKTTDGRLVARPLPADLKLPAYVLDGVVEKTDHVYADGYLRREGDRELTSRERTLQQIRNSGRLG